MKVRFFILFYIFFIVPSSAQFTEQNEEWLAAFNGDLPAIHKTCHSHGVIISASGAIHDTPEALKIFE